jgi:Pyridoxamine 5'-phosphate oxidase
MTDAPSLAATARQVINTSRYLVLATADQHGVPWASPVWYAHGGYREFFWESRPQARHSRNIATRPQVSIVIFDSSMPPRAAQAVYIRGAARSKIFALAGEPGRPAPGHGEENEMSVAEACAPIPVPPVTE